MNIKWLGCPNYTPQREGVTITHIVLHTMVGTVDSANARFQNPLERASAHYGVGYDGNVVQWVPDGDAAWHCGDWGMNMASIGIEHEDHGQYDAPRPDALYAASIMLVRDLSRRYNIPASNILCHREVIATGCPDALDTQRIISGATINNEDSMTTNERIDVGRALTRLFYLAVNHRELESQAAQDGWSQRMVNGSFDATLSDMADHFAEPQANLHADYARDHPTLPGVK